MWQTLIICWVSKLGRRTMRWLSVSQAAIRRCTSRTRFRTRSSCRSHVLYKRFRVIGCLPNRSLRRLRARESCVRRRSALLAMWKRRLVSFLPQSVTSPSALYVVAKRADTRIYSNSTVLRLRQSLALAVHVHTLHKTDVNEPQPKTKLSSTQQQGCLKIGAGFGRGCCFVNVCI